MTTVSRRHLFGLLAGAAVAPHLPAAAPLAQAATAFNPQDLDRLWAERMFKEYMRQSEFAPFIKGGKSPIRSRFDP